MFGTSLAIPTVALGLLISGFFESLGPILNGPLSSPRTAATLAEDCERPTPEPAGDPACTGYLLGVARAGPDGQTSLLINCLDYVFDPRSLEYIRTVRATFLRYLFLNTDQASEPAFLVIKRALADGFPCPR